MCPPVQFLLGLHAVLDCLADEGVGGGALDVIDVQTAKVLLFLGWRPPAARIVSMDYLLLGNG